ncbi:putative ribonuclease H-like domain-containing protein [Tanacetum coccineum]
MVMKSTDDNNDDMNLAFIPLTVLSLNDVPQFMLFVHSTQGSQLVHEDLEQLHDDDLKDKEIDLMVEYGTDKLEGKNDRGGAQEVKTKTIGIKETHQRHKHSSFMASHILRLINDNLVLNLVCKYEALKKQYDDLLVKLDDTGFKLLQIQRGHKEYLMGLLRTELEKVKEEREGFEFKIAKFEKSSKDLDQLLASLQEFKKSEVNEYGLRDSSVMTITGCDKESNNSKENTDDFLKQQQKTDSSLFKSPLKVSDDEEEVEPIPKVEKKTAIPYLIIRDDYPKHIVPRAVLMKTGLKTVNNARPVNTVRSVNTGRPFSTARQTVNTVRQNVNTVRAKGFNAVKPSACWVWRPIKPNGASLSNSQLNDKGFVDSGCSRHMSGNIAHLSDFKDFDGGYVTFGGGANGGRITGKDILKIPRQDNMYSFDMKNIVPKDGLTCLVAKSTSEELRLCIGRTWFLIVKPHNKTHYETSLENNGTVDQQVNTANPEVNTGSRDVSTAVPKVNTATPEDLMGPIPTSEDTQVENQEIELGNISPSYAVSFSYTRIHKDHPILIMLIGVNVAVFVQQEMTYRVSKALSNPAWVEAIQEELLQFKLTKKDERGIVIRNKARLVAQGHTQEEGINYDEVFAPVARIEAIRIFLAYASYMGFTVYQMDVKSAFLYGQIEEEDDIIFGSTKKELYDEFEKLMTDNSTYSDVKSASTPTDLEKSLVQDGDADDVDEHLYRSMVGSLMYLTASRPDIMFAFAYNLIVDYVRATLDRKSPLEVLCGNRFLKKKVLMLVDFSYLVSSIGHAQIL